MEPDCLGGPGRSLLRGRIERGILLFLRDKSDEKTGLVQRLRIDAPFVAVVFGGKTE